MPREYTLRTDTPITIIEVALAANSVDPTYGIRGVGGTDTLQICGPDDSPVLTILPSVELSAGSPPVEVDPVADANGWLIHTEALAPWHGSHDEAEQLLALLAQLCDGHVSGCPAPVSERTS